MLFAADAVSGENPHDTKNTAATIPNSQPIRDFISFPFFKKDFRNHSDLK